MNVVAIYSSPRPKGSTSTILTELINNIQVNDGITIDTFNTNKLNIKPCIGCLKCRPDKDCILPPDDAHLISVKIRDADLLIVAAPTYWGNIPGTLKILFDRIVTTFEYCEPKSLYRFPKPRLKGTKAIIITSAIAPYPFNLMRTQSGGVVKALKIIFRAGGIKTSHIIRVSGSSEFEKHKDKYLKKAKKLGQSIK